MVTGAHRNAVSQYLRALSQRTNQPLRDHRLRREMASAACSWPTISTVQQSVSGDHSKFGALDLVRAAIHGDPMIFPDDD